MKMVTKLALLLILALSFTGCSSFKAQRVDSDTSDELAMEITDKWMVRDTEIAIRKTLKKMESHRGFKRYLTGIGRPPKVFIAEVQNQTSEAYFPIDDMNDELLSQVSESGDFILIDAAARDKILKEITYQNDGMVDPNEAKSIGKQAGADLLIFGSVNMKEQRRGGKTIKEYTVNIRMTNIERATEVFRSRVRVNKYSKQSKAGW